MDTLESEEDRDKKRKLGTCEGKLTKPSEDALFFRKDIIDALKRSEEKRRKDGKVSTENLGFSRSTDPRDELNHCENGRRTDTSKSVKESRI